MSVATAAAAISRRFRGTRRMIDDPTLAAAATTTTTTWWSLGAPSVLTGAPSVCQFCTPAGNSARHQLTAVELDRQFSSAEIPREQFPRSIFVTSSRGCSACRRIGEDATRKLLPWNSIFTARRSICTSGGQVCHYKQSFLSHDMFVQQV